MAGKQIDPGTLIVKAQTGSTAALGTLLEAYRSYLLLLSRLHYIADAIRNIGTKKCSRSTLIANHHQRTVAFSAGA
jgi:hypothetical protein